MLELGITLPTMPPPDTRPPDITRLASEVEALGLDSVWVPDLIVGDGTPGLEAVVALTAAAAVTERIGVGFGTLVLPTRDLAWLGTQLATLQHVSGNRLRLGVGVGGFPYSPFWQALGVPPDERGARTDAALRALPSLITGTPTTTNGTELTLAPGAPMPPVHVGGNSAAAIRRSVRYGDGWFPSLVGPAELAARVPELTDVAGAFDRTRPEITVGGHVVFDQAAHEHLVRDLVDTHRMHPDVAERVPMPGGSPAALAERFAAYVEAGVSRVVTGPDAENESAWLHQCELLAEARRRLD